LRPTDQKYTALGSIILRNYLTHYDYFDLSVGFASISDTVALCKTP